MLVRTFLCCLPLIWGVFGTGLVFGTVDLVLGSIGWTLVIQDNYPDWLLELLRKMDTKSWVAVCSTIPYILAMVHFMLIYAAYTANHLLIGIWLLVNFTMFLLTLVTGLLSVWALLRLVVIGYCIVVVKSYYDKLITPIRDDEATRYRHMGHSEEDA